MAKSPKATDIDADAVRKLADLLNETGLTEIEYTHDDWSLRVSKGAVAVAAASPAAVPAPAAAAADHGPPAGAVTSPMVGVVYTSPDPDSPAFVKEGDVVKEGQTLLLIEAMKVFNQIAAPRAGTVKKILVTSGTPVEFGEPLLILE
ncbi:MAG: acetyl-CoA carboxylase biotin carboxyl carrier protein subunit [Rhodospirillales bacterium CG15_BIG_FIL_POST_REV_8_21_14_020_66_15]|nr:MAG: acetyl-CoA carboxylase biotin carboxyl carrier protein subunit [Rhodospirillales bacterium CG15_BIG_FIL_POST_REV_8_21_14_020_66_15]